MDLQELRDLAIVVYALAATAVMVVATLVAAVGGWALVRGLRLADRQVQRKALPALGKARRGAIAAQGATDRLAHWVVEPVSHVQAALAGVRRGLAVALGLERQR